MIFSFHVITPVFVYGEVWKAKTKIDSSQSGSIHEIFLLVLPVRIFLTNAYINFI